MNYIVISTGPNRPDGRKGSLAEGPLMTQVRRCSSGLRYSPMPHGVCNNKDSDNLYSFHRT